MFLLGNLLTVANLFVLVPSGAQVNPLHDPLPATANAQVSVRLPELKEVRAMRAAPIAALENKDWLRAQRPSANIIQRLWHTAEAMNPDVSMGQLPGRLGVRLTLSVNALAFTRL
jgi:hypothetical protein